VHPFSSWARLPLGFVLAALVAYGGGVQAQLAPRPGDERIEPPDFETPEQEDVPLLPPLELPEEPSRLAGVPTIQVKEFRVTGNTAFSDEELIGLLERYVGRRIASEDLVAIRDILTRHYVDHGYVNSGAVLPDQDPSDGVVRVEIVEGRLTEVRFEGRRYYRETALRWKISEGLSVPLDEKEIEARLQLLKQDPRIESVRAQLLPGAEPGEGRLVVELEERAPYRGYVEFSNFATVGVGALRGRVEARHENLAGLGDVLRIRYDGADGLDRVKGRYELPFTPFGTSVRFDAEYSESKIVEGDDNIDRFDIKGEYRGYEGGLIQALYESPSFRVRAGLLGGWRRSKIKFFDGVLFEPKEEITTLRLLTEAVYRGRNNVFAARSLLTQGLDARGGAANQVTTDWLGQLQWVSRFGGLGIESVARVDVQLAADPLVAIEQFAIGGHDTVRGYRENETIRDQGAIGSVEIRLPLWRSEDASSGLKLAPFVDVAHGWNHRDSLFGSEARTIIGAGVGLRLALTRYSRAQLYWGHNFDDTRGTGDLQDAGIQFRIVLGLF
jgi:hemolysin activation/secretion protein